MLAGRGRIALDLPVTEWRLRVNRARHPGGTPHGDIAIAAATLADFRADPADRLIVATAMAIDASLVTADDRILGRRGTLACHDARR